MKLSAYADSLRDKGAEGQRDRADGFFYFVPLHLCHFVPFFLCACLAAHRTNRRREFYSRSLRDNNLL
jgi:hypothetical protein